MYTFRSFFIPDYMMGGIKHYIDEGQMPGRFLTAVICNDLKEAVEQADDNNLPNIAAFVSYFYNEAPSACWGSAVKMNAWIDHKREMNKKEELC